MVIILHVCTIVLKEYDVCYSHFWFLVQIHVHCTLHLSSDYGIRSCPIMLQNLPVSLVYKSHVCHLYISLTTDTP